MGRGKRKKEDEGKGEKKGRCGIDRGGSPPPYSLLPSLPLPFHPMPSRGGHRMERERKGGE